MNAFKNIILGQIMLFLIPSRWSAINRACSFSKNNLLLFLLIRYFFKANVILREYKFRVFSLFTEVKSNTSPDLQFVSANQILTS